jgi:helicase MOV-10
VKHQGAKNPAIVHNSPRRLTVTFRQSHIGRYNDRVDIVFLDIQRRQRFIVSRTLHAVIGSKADHDLLKPVAPYAPRPRTKREIETEVVPGERPESMNAVPWVVRLLQAKIPKRLFSTLSGSSSSDMMGMLRQGYIPSTLTHKNYGNSFQALLWVEEFQMEYVEIASLYKFIYVFVKA